MKGQSLLESVLALAVIAIVLSAIAVVSTNSLSDAGRGKYQTLATQYAQEGVEVLRKIRNINYTSFRNNYNGTYCLAKGASSLTSSSTCQSPPASNVDSFIRTVTIERSPGCATNVVKATVKVAWTDGKCNTGAWCHASTIVTCLSSVNPVQLMDGSNQIPAGNPAPPTATPTQTPAGNPAPPTATPTQTQSVATSIAFSISPNPARTNESVVFRATVTGTGCTPTGAVYFYWDNQTVRYTAGSTGNSNPGIATAAYPASGIGIGSHQAFARYVPTGTICPGVDSAGVSFVVQ